MYRAQLIFDMKSNIRQQSIPKTFWMNEKLYDIAEGLGYISKQDVMNYTNLRVNILNPFIQC